MLISTKEDHDSCATMEVRHAIPGPVPDCTVLGDAWDMIYKQCTIRSLWSQVNLERASVRRQRTLGDSPV
jgi:hypothetical protein